MIILFEGKSNYKRHFINSAILKTPSGNVVLDRKKTVCWFSEITRSHKMEWHSPFIWDGENNLPVTDELLSKAELLKLEIEDDAPEDYFLTPTSVIFQRPNYEIGHMPLAKEFRSH